MWRYSQRNEATLAMAAERPIKNLYRNLTAVIVEASEPLFLEECEKYLVHIKIIDSTFNFTQMCGKSSLKFHKYAHIYIYADSLAEVPQITQVGDILRMYFVRFGVSQKGELTSYSDAYCDWRTYDARGTFEAPLSYNQSRRKVEMVLNDDELNYIRYVSGWGQKFLGQNILKDVLWWNSLKVPENDSDEDPQPQKGLDLIVQCAGWKLTSRQADFCDKYGNKFALKVPGKQVLAKGTFYKLGEVEATLVSAKDRRYTLKPSKYFVLNQLPDDCKDVLFFEKLFQQVLEEKKEEIEACSGSLGKKSDWENKNSPFATLVAKTRLSAPELTLAQAAALLKKPENQIGKLFLLTGQISEFLPKRGSEMVRKLILSNSVVYPINSTFLKNLDSVIVFHFVFTLQDGESTTKVPIYVNTADTLDNPFIGWSIFPDVHNVWAWQEMKTTVFQKFEKRLEGVVKGGAEVRVAVRLLQTKSKKIFLKLVDTRF